MSEPTDPTPDPAVAHNAHLEAAWEKAHADAEARWGSESPSWFTPPAGNVLMAALEALPPDTPEAEYHGLAAAHVATPLDKIGRPKKTEAPHVD